MWIVGHTAFAFLLIWVLYIIRGKRIQPSLVIFIFVFANLPDALHAGILRAFTHNPAGTFLFAVFWLLFFNRFGLIEKRHFPVLLLATGTHVLNDYLFSGYQFLFPWKDTEFRVFAFNSFEDLLVESVLVLAFVIILFTAGDAWRMKSYMQGEKRRLLNRFTLRNALDPGFFPFYLFVAFFTGSILEFLFYTYLSWHGLMALVWHNLLFFALFLLFLTALALIVFRRTSKVQEETND
jgi:hypothetical protein